MGYIPTPHRLEVFVVFRRISACSLLRPEETDPDLGFCIIPAWSPGQLLSFGERRKGAIAAVRQPEGVTWTTFLATVNAFQTRSGCMQIHCRQ
ncbi:hypothetical protein DSUL_20088 [Desulfovibrionales bacterium]